MEKHTLGLLTLGSTKLYPLVPSRTFQPCEDENFSSSGHRILNLLALWSTAVFGLCTCAPLFFLAHRAFQVMSLPSCLPSQLALLSSFVCLLVCFGFRLYLIPTKATQQSWIWLMVHEWGVKAAGTYTAGHVAFASGDCVYCTV